MNTIIITIVLYLFHITFQLLIKKSCHVDGETELCLALLMTLLKPTDEVDESSFNETVEELKL